MTRRNKRGFTLVEAAVAAALFVAVVGLAMAMFFQAPSAEVRMGKKVDLHGEARRSYFTMTEELKLGTELLQPSLNATTPFILFSNVTYEIIGYYLRVSPKDPKKRQLVRINFNEKNPEPKVMCETVKQLKFTRKGRREVAVRFSFRESDKNQLQLVNSITLRNTLNAL